MNVYDFDKTIYDGDSTLDFYVYCLRKQPTLIALLPIQLFAYIKYQLGITDKLIFKEKFYGFLKYLKNRDNILNDFWRLNYKKVKPWYLEIKKEDDVIISASPEFLLQPICKELDLQYLIASKVDFLTGKCIGKNCYGNEKVDRFNLKFKNTCIENFYSDSLSDSPMAELAKKSFIVYKNQIVEWQDFKPRKIKNIFFNFEFILFILVGIINTFNGVFFSLLFSMFFNISTAFIYGYICSLCISFILNSLFVFKSTLNIARFIKFIISYIPNFLIQFISIIIFINIFNLPKMVVYSLAAIIGVPLTFIIMKVFTFNK